MTELDGELQGLSKELIDEYGADISYKRVGETKYNPATSRNEETGEFGDIKAIVEDVNPATANQIKGTSSLIQAGDKKITCAPESFATPPQGGDKFVIDGDTYTVPENGVVAYRSGQLVAIYEIYGRM